VPVIDIGKVERNLVAVVIQVVVEPLGLDLDLAVDDYNFIIQVMFH